MTKVRNYTDKELLNRVKSLKSYDHIPKDYWILGVRSKADTYDVFDDKFYIFKGEKFIDVMTGTTNTGAYGLMNFHLWNKKGVAQVVANEIYYGVWNRGKHKSKVEALVQISPFKIIRDNNKNKKSGDKNVWSWENWIGINFHPNTYNLLSTIKKWTIGQWSVGCQVINDIPKYKKFLEYTKPQRTFTYCLLDEF